MALASLKTADKRDGRRLRSELSREAIVEAMLDLLREGRRPGAQQIAERAGVSLRSVFRHFEDLDGLFTIAATLQRRKTRHLFDIGAPNGTLEERIGNLVDHRARLYEEVTPTRRVAVFQAPLHPPLRAGLTEANTQLRRQLPRIFAAELRRQSAASRRELLEAVEAATSWGTWETLRVDQRLSIDRAKRIVRRTLLSLLKAR